MDKLLTVSYVGRAKLKGRPWRPPTYLEFGFEHGHVTAGRPWRGPNGVKNRPCIKIVACIAHARPVLPPTMLPTDTTIPDQRTPCNDPFDSANVPRQNRSPTTIEGAYSASPSRSRRCHNDSGTPHGVPRPHESASASAIPNRSPTAEGCIPHHAATSNTDPPGSTSALRGPESFTIPAVRFATLDAAITLCHLPSTNTASCTIYASYRSRVLISSTIYSFEEDSDAHQRMYYCMSDHNYPPPHHCPSNTITFVLCCTVRIISVKSGV